MTMNPSHIFVGPAAAALVACLVTSLTPHGVAARPSMVVSQELRAAPWPDAEIVDHFAPGVSVSFLVQRGAWLGVRHGDGIAWAHTDQRQPEESEADTCRAPSKMVPHPHDRIGVIATARLRSRQGHDSDRDPRLPPGARVWVHASDRGGSWILVENATGDLGWVRRCEIDGIARKSGDRVVVAHAGELLSRARDGRSITPLATGDRVTIVASAKDWVQIATEDGVRGWYPAEKLAHDTLDETEPASLWQPGMIADWPCGESSPPSPMKRGSVRCGDRVRIIRATGGDKHPVLLVVADDGRWGWIDERVTPIETGSAVVEGARRTERDDQRAVAAATRRPASPEAMRETTMDGDAKRVTASGRDTRRALPVNRDAMPGMKIDGDSKSAGAEEQDSKHPIATAVDANAAADHGAMSGMNMDGDTTASAAERAPATASEPTRELGHEAMMGMGMGDMSMPTEGAAMSMSLQTAFPVGDGAMSMSDGTGDTMMPRTPRYEVSVTTSGSARLGSGFDAVLAATFSAAGSMTADGQSRHEKYQGGQASLSVSRRLGEHLKVALGGGYSLAFVAPGDTASSDWMFLAIQPGPFARLSLAGDLGQSWSYSLRGTAQLSKDADGMPASILVADAMMMVSLNRWLTAGLNGMAMKMAMGDTMVSAGPSLSVAFLKKLSETIAATAMNSAGMTMWTLSTGVGVHF